MNLNHCDGGHATTSEVRLLPTGGGGNLIVCRIHYGREMIYRRKLIRDKHATLDNVELPEWESLKIYSVDSEVGNEARR